jgi:hypothetical protein
LSSSLEKAHDAANIKITLIAHNTPIILTILMTLRSSHFLKVIKPRFNYTQ